jgi:hypothetical protein
MHEDVPLIVCGAPGGGQRFVRPRRPGLSRAGRAVVDVSLRHSHIRYVLCLRRVLANRYAFRTWACGYGVGRVSVYVVRPPYWRLAARRASGSRTGARTEDPRPAGGPPAAGRPTCYQQLRARPSPRGRPHAARTGEQPWASATVTLTDYRLCDTNVHM